METQFKCTNFFVAGKEIEEDKGTLILKEQNSQMMELLVTDAPGWNKDIRVGDKILVLKKDLNKYNDVYFIEEDLIIASTYKVPKEEDDRPMSEEEFDKLPQVTEYITN